LSRWLRPWERPLVAMLMERVMVRLGICLVCCVAWMGCGADARVEPDPIVIIVEEGEDQAVDLAADLAAPVDMEALDMDAPDVAPVEDMALVDMEQDQGMDMPPPVDMAPDMAPDPCEGFQDAVLIKPNCGPAPLTVRFDGTGVLSGFTDVRDYYWELSDGSIVSQAAFDATYNTPGETEELFHFVAVVDGTRITGSINAKVRALP
jgi:hypothetical protein